MPRICPSSEPNRQPQVLNVPRGSPSAYSGALRQRRLCALETFFKYIRRTEMDKCVTL